MTSLVLLILGGVIVISAGGAAGVIAFSEATGMALGRQAVFVCLAVLAVVVFGVAALFVRRSSRVHEVTITSDGITIAAGHRVCAYPWSEVDRLLIRTDGDYARIAVSSAPRGSLTLLSGVLTPSFRPPARRSMNDLPDVVRRIVRTAGFIEERRPTRAPRLHRFRRPDR